MRVVELFSGIGGCARALGNRADVRLAIDQSEHARAVYGLNFPDHPQRAWNLAGVKARQLSVDADLWWLSPPCQPFTVRGQRRDIDDPRCRPLLRLVSLLAEVGPRHLALENVPGFATSRMRDHLIETLDTLGYHHRERLLCPTQLGIPMRRRRYYLVASRDRLPDWHPLRPHRTRVEPALDPDVDPSLYLDDAFLERYAGKLPISDPVHTPWVGCFTSAYGRSPVFAGSYWRDAHGVRQFSPTEILRLMGFGDDFSLPSDLSRAQAYKRIGNSLSVDAVRCVLAVLRPPYSR